MTQKKVPLRRCAGCNRQGEKASFVRIVRTPDGVITFDKSGKQSGRGVYLCPDIKCIEKVKKSRRIEKTLGVSVPDEVYEETKKQIEEML